MRNGASGRVARSGHGERGAQRSGRVRALKHLPRGPLRPAGRGRSTPWTTWLPLAHSCPRRLAARQQPLVPLSLPQPSGHGRQVVGEGQLYGFPSLAATILPQRPRQAAPRRNGGATLTRPFFTSTSAPRLSELMCRHVRCSTSLTFTFVRCRTTGRTRSRLSGMARGRHPASVRLGRTDRGHAARTQRACRIDRLSARRAAAA